MNKFDRAQLPFFPSIQTHFVRLPMSVFNRLDRRHVGSGNIRDILQATPATFSTPRKKITQNLRNQKVAHIFATE